MNNKSILVLGGGRGQVGLISAAKARGLTTIVASLPSDNAPGLLLADRIVHADISDPVAIMEAAKELRIDAIATSCADTGLTALGATCDMMGLTGLSFSAAEYCADKILMKQAFESAGVRTARYRVVSTANQLEDVLTDLAFPVIVKATDLQGSKGISIATDIEEARTGFRTAMSLTKKQEVIVEEFIEGVEFGAQALVADGQVLFVLPHGDEVHEASTPVPVGHYLPLDHKIETPSSVESEVIKAIRSLGLNDCAVNVDLILRDGEIFVIEITGRVGANGLPELVSAYYGIDYYDTIVGLAINDESLNPRIFERANEKAIGIRMLKSPDAHGVVETVDIDFSSVPAAKYTMFISPGKTISGFTTSADCLGQVQVEGDTIEDMFSLLDKSEAAVKITLRETNRA